MTPEAGAGEPDAKQRTPAWGWMRLAVFAYLIRFPLIAAAALFFVPIFACEGWPLESILGGAFELSTACRLDFEFFFAPETVYVVALGAAYVVTFGLTLAWTVLVTTRLVWMYGPYRYVDLAVALQRTNVAEKKVSLFRKLIRWLAAAFERRWLAAMDSERWFGHVAIAFLIVPLIARVARTNALSLATQTFKMPTVSTVAIVLVAGVIGTVAAVALFWLAELLHRVLRPPSDSAERSLRFLLLPPHREGWLTRLERRADRRDPQYNSRIYRWIAAFFSKIAKWFGPGYREPDNPEPRLLAGHALAMVLLLAAIVLHLLLGLPHLYFRTSSPPDSLPLLVVAELPATLPYLISAGILLTWLLCGLSFLVDRLRVPVALPIVLWFYLMKFVAWNDHRFLMQRRDWSTPAAPDAAAVVGDRETIVVVAASGGGIRATAWTARVLAGLEELARKDPELRARHIRFAPQVRLMSGVSGGSLAVLQFASWYQYHRAELSFDPHALVNWADQSSLDPLVWGLVYPDFRLAFFPFAGRPSTDRGMELERAWDVARDQVGRRFPAGLAKWRQRTIDGFLPALIFNATDAETGERILIGTTTMKNEEQTGRILFDRLFRSQWDLAPLTAVRMSATFPFVTPAAKPAEPPMWPNRGDSSWVDGGYADNFGMASLLNWLPEVLNNEDSCLRRVLVVEIRASPDPLKGSTQVNAGRGIFYQLGIPLEAMLSVWNSGQAVRNDTQLAMIQLAWPYERGYEIVDTNFTLNLDPNADGSPATLPLSWHLTRHQREQLDDAWAKLANDPYGPWPAVKQFLLTTK